MRRQLKPYVSPVKAGDGNVDIIFVSDQHLGSGDPELEDFKQDTAMASLLDKVVREREPDTVTVLVHGGDLEDPTAVTSPAWDPSRNLKQSEAIAQLKVIVEAHPDYYDGLKRFIRQPDTELLKIVGNHDLAFVLPGVQEWYIDMLVEGDQRLRKKISFIDHKSWCGDEQYRFMYRRGLFKHGIGPEEEHNRLPERPVIRQRFGHELEEPELRSILGNVLVVRLMNPLKRLNYIVSRLPEDSAAWSFLAWHEWKWSLTAAKLAFVTALLLIKDSFVVFSSKDGFLTACRTVMDKIRRDLWAIVASSGSDERRRVKWVSGEARKLGARYVIEGHSHKPMRMTSDGLTHINVGCAATQYKLVDPDIVLTWGFMPRMETFCRKLQRHGARQRITRILWSVAMIMLGMSVVVVVAASLGVHDWKSLWWLLPFMAFGLSLGLIPFLRLIAVRPEIVEITRLPFAYVRHKANDPDEEELRVDLMEYIHGKDAYREIV